MTAPSRQQTVFDMAMAQFLLVGGGFILLFLALTSLVSAWAYSNLANV